MKWPPSFEQRNGATYTAPAGITLSATAAESGGTISRIDFYSGASLLGAATAAPYTHTWSNVPGGSYTVSVWRTHPALRSNRRIR